MSLETFAKRCPYVEKRLVFCQERADCVGCQCYYEERGLSETREIVGILEGGDNYETKRRA